MKSKLQVSKPTLFLCGFLFIAQFIYGFSAVRVGFSESSYYWYLFTFYWALSWWFLNDSRNQSAAWVDGYMDVGMFLYIAWIFFVPYYLFKTRGWKKALLMIGIFLGIFFGAYILGVILYSITSIF